MSGKHEALVPFNTQARRAGHFDVCVVGGSCTGVFAAVRAARLGANVALLEQANRFGGVATLGLVGMWHSLFDTTGERQIIRGLTFETLERLEKSGSVTPFRGPAPSGIRMNTDELTLVLDKLVLEHRRITPFLHTRYCGVSQSAPDRLQRVFAADKSGLLAIDADCFIDASGDGALCRDAGVVLYRHPAPQPPTACCRLEDFTDLSDLSLHKLFAQYRDSLPDLPPGYHWGADIPGSKIYMLAATRVLDSDCSEAEGTTRAEFTSRKQIAALLEMLRRNYPGAHLSLQALPACIGIRDGMHITSFRQLRGEELLHGHNHPDAIGNGTYPIDIHSGSDDKIEFYRLDGNHIIHQAGKIISKTRWLPEGQSLPFYRFTLSPMLPKTHVNLLAAGRMLDADPMAFGAVRVMVNLNQCGEAAGVVAALASKHGQSVNSIAPKEVRKTLEAGGSCVI